MKAKELVRIVECIDKKQKKLWKKEDIKIPIFIPIYAQNLYLILFTIFKMVLMSIQSIEYYSSSLNVRALKDFSTFMYPKEIQVGKKNLSKKSS